MGVCVYVCWELDRLRVSWDRGAGAAAAGGGRAGRWVLEASREGLQDPAGRLAMPGLHLSQTRCRLPHTERGAWQAGRWVHRGAAARLGGTRPLPPAAPSSPASSCTGPACPQQWSCPCPAGMLGPPGRLRTPPCGAQAGRLRLAGWRRPAQAAGGRAAGVAIKQRGGGTAGSGGKVEAAS